MNLKWGDAGSGLPVARLLIILTLLAGQYFFTTYFALPLLIDEN